MAKGAERGDDDSTAFDEGDFDVASLRRVEVQRGQPKSSLAVRFDAADLERLRRRADAEGVGVTQLARRWVLDRLDEPDDAGTVDDLIDALDKSVRAARALKKAGARRAG